MKRHLLSDRLKVKPDNYDLFEESLAGMDERNYLYLAGYTGTSFGALLADEIKRRHPELDELRAIDIWDVWENEIGRAHV